MSTIAVSPNLQLAAPGSPASRPRSEASVVRAAPAPAPSPMRCQRVGLPPGDLGIAKTIHAMDRLAGGREGSHGASIRSLATAILKGVPARDSAAEIKALFAWVKSHIAFRGEQSETLQSPEVTVRLAAGDCDCQAILLAALLRAVGYETRFVTVAADPNDPRSYSHVYLEVKDKRTGAYIPLDTTEARSDVGWQPGAVYRRRAWRSLGDSAANFPGLPATGATPGQDFLALVNQFGQPLVDAAAQRIAYGRAPFAPGLSPTPFGGGISPITQGSSYGAIALTLIGVGLIGAFAFGRRGR